MHRGQERKQRGRHSWFEGKRSKVLRRWLRLQWGREGVQPLYGSDGRRPHPEERVHCWGHRTDGGSEAVQRRALDAPTARLSRWSVLSALTIITSRRFSDVLPCPLTSAPASHI